jgi:hypothetical protein
MHHLQKEPDKGIQIYLEPDEVLICEIIGRLRSLNSRAANVPDYKIGAHSGEDADVMGVKGEYAFAKLFNTFPDLGLTPRSGSADGVLMGISYDVKSTRYPEGKLIATKKINPDVDMYVLAVVTEPDKIDIKGYLLKEHFIKDTNIHNIGHGECYCVPQTALNKFKKVKAQPFRN